MQRIDDRFIYSASDLNDALACDHLVELERLVTLGKLDRPEADPSTKLLADKGEEHESLYLRRMQERHGTDVVVFDRRPAPTTAAMEAAHKRTVAAMASGARIIYQAFFFDGTFVGRADFLRRVERPCERWAWSYEAIDTKLALSAKPHYLIQLCNYSEHLARIQGTPPREMHIVLGSGSERHFRTEDFAAYYRRAKTDFLERMSAGPGTTYPFEIAHCLTCRWRVPCADRRKADDHLSVVAFMRNDQIEKLNAGGITTIASLAGAHDDKRPRSMREGSFAKLRSQAALQHEHHVTGKHRYEFLAADGERHGFALLPPPADGDIFFDMEGDPLYRPDRGLEYLFGVYLKDEGYRGFWATDASKERAAFEAFVDFVSEQLQRYPDLHVYHYAPYETTALKRLAGRFGSRETELDNFLERGLFIDLYAVVRQAIRISQPSYSIKKLETFYGMERSTKTLRGDDSIVMFESWMTSGDDSILEDIERYNDDDCRSTYLLREWLIRLREEFNAAAEEPVAFRTAPQIRERPEEERTVLEAKLLDGLVDFDSLTTLRSANDATRARWLLGHMLQYHRRESKPEWWRYFERTDNPVDLEEYDREAIGGLQWLREIAPAKVKASDRNSVYAYTYPAQDHHLRGKPICPYTQKSAGEIISLDDERRILRIKLAGAIAPQDLRALIPGKPLPNAKQRTALERIATLFLAGTLETKHRALYDLLLARPPRLTHAPAQGRIQPDIVDAQHVSAIVASLDRSALFIQGPPGSGKSTTGAQAIVDLLIAGKRVAVVANSHKAVHNLLRKIEETAHSRSFVFNGCHKSSAQTEGSSYTPYAPWPLIATNETFEGIGADCRLVSGTTFSWADERLTGAFDYVFIDEAGQVALADALIVAASANNVVLLGDPRQLPQVSQGSHPVGADVSVLEYLLGAGATISASRGVFLDTSYRMHPEICEFISSMFYEERLHADAANEQNRIFSDGARGSGLRFVPVTHTGNSRYSLQEADCIVAEVRALLRGIYTVRDRPAARLTQDDILIVTPYNLQRKKISESLAAAGFPDVRIGTVDKFQGQEAPVVLYSMATSGSANLPRDLEFLFDANRFNVALSRAQCLSILVCSPALLSVRCSSPEQMARVNLLCAFAEAANAGTRAEASSLGGAQ